MPQSPSFQLPDKVRLVEVGPRDGLQNETQALDIDSKLQLIERLVAAGLKTIEAGSFVNPRWVPQMADSDELFQALPTMTEVTFTALTPNLKGLERAIKAGVREVAVFAAATESFSQKNINCSIDESMERFRPVVEKSREHGIAVRGYISCVVACPYEGSVSPQAVQKIASKLLSMGCYEISLGDTIGAGTPRQIVTLLQELGQTITMGRLAMHLHDTYGQAIANTYAALQAGVAAFDCSVAGLGGCPYAPGASGNVATEDVVYLLNGLGIEHGVDLNRLIEAGRFISEKLDRDYRPKAGVAMMAGG
ncbi:MAG: hydroxymethylglutaryl-CoA lyase [Cellvibrionaceae bacterium]